MTHTYEFRFRGRLSRALRSEFAELDLTGGATRVETVLAGPVEDGAALHGLLRKIESLGLELVEVRQLSEGDPE